MAPQTESKQRKQMMKQVDAGLDRELHQLMDPLADKLSLRTSPDNLLIARRPSKPAEKDGALKFPDVKGGSQAELKKAA
jgi:hypothetical protein